MTGDCCAKATDAQETRKQNVKIASLNRIFIIETSCCYFSFSTGLLFTTFFSQEDFIHRLSRGYSSLLNQADAAEPSIAFLIVNQRLIEFGFAEIGPQLIG